VTQYKRGPLSRQFCRPEAPVPNAGHIESAGPRHAPETLGARWLSLKTMLRVPAEVFLKSSTPGPRPRHAESFYDAFINSSSAWEWDLTTPNTRLYRLGR